MMLNAFQNRRSGPGGSARRLHQLGGVFTSNMSWLSNPDGGAETGSTRAIKGKSVSVMVPSLSGHFIFANDNFVVANDNSREVAIAA